MISELISVIADEHDSGMVILTGFFKHFKEPADIVVDLRHQSVIGSAQPAQGVFIPWVISGLIIPDIQILVQQKFKIGMLFLLFFYRRIDDTGGHVIGMVHLMIGFGG